MLITLCSQLEGDILNNEDPVHNEPLPHLYSTYCDRTDIVEDEKHAEDQELPQQNDAESQIENANAESAESPSSAGEADAQTDISGVLSDADTDGENRVMGPAPGWPDGMVSPLEERNTSKDLMGPAAHHSSTSATMLGTAATNSNNGHEASKSSDSEMVPKTTPEMPPISSDLRVSYAVAIYPYMAEQEDEFDVVV
jgi:bZIP factor